MTKKIETVWVSVELPAGLLAKARQMLADRGTTLDDHFRLALRTLTKMPVQHLLTSVYSFGKYRDETLEVVIRSDPKYVQWCLDNIAGFDVDEEAEELLRHFLPAERDDVIVLRETVKTETRRTQSGRAKKETPDGGAVQQEAPRSKRSRAAGAASPRRRGRGGGPDVPAAPVGDEAGSGPSPWGG